MPPFPKPSSIPNLRSTESRSRRCSTRGRWTAQTGRHRSTCCNPWTPSWSDAGCGGPEGTAAAGRAVPSHSGRQSQPEHGSNRSSFLSPWLSPGVQPESFVLVTLAAEGGSAAASLAAAQSLAPAVTVRVGAPGRARAGRDSLSTTQWTQSQAPTATAAAALSGSYVGAGGARDSPSRAP